MLIDIMRTVLLIALVTMTLAFFVMACAVRNAPQHGKTPSSCQRMDESLQKTSSSLSGQRSHV